jgi:hypothetical protein
MLLTSGIIALAAMLLVPISLHPVQAQCGSAPPAPTPGQPAGGSSASACVQTTGPGGVVVGPSQGAYSNSPTGSSSIAGGGATSIHPPANTVDGTTAYSGPGAPTKSATCTAAAASPAGAKATYNDGSFPGAGSQPPSCSTSSQSP